ncbi:MAG: glycoside hydrolase family 2 protein [Anaerolineae bacterium]|nr:glycoside hydrolase family 2 protein [Anaerolineae bacterium]
MPGSVHLDLMRHGRIPDPFLYDNEEKVQWIIDQEWQYRCQFEVNQTLILAEKQVMVFNGIDTIASVSLNGTLLGKTDNMFRTYEWDVTTLINTTGSNELLVTFPSVGKFLTEKLSERTVKGVGALGIDGSYYMRKAPCHFGWDWGPALPPIGIWQPVTIEGRNLAFLKDVHFRQQHGEDSVMISATLDVGSLSNVPVKAIMRVTAPDGKSWTTQKYVQSECDLSINVDNPQLWYPNGYGAQPLYDVMVTLESDDDILDSKAVKMGLRTLELRQEPDQWGKSFTFVVNDIPIFAKGSNWIPADSFPTRLTHARMERWIADTAAAHQNMLRVWGGGLYETDDFYTLCDQYGILVWQDCIFACKIYPLHQDQFIENIRHEIIDNARRIRHHASLALWCGNNEMEWGWEDWHWNCAENSDLKSGYDTFFHYLLPKWLKTLDPDTPYWPSSPSSDTPFFNVNGQEQGDAHYWDVWHKGAPFTAYRNQYPRFMSEFGFQAFPPIETIHHYTNPEDRNLTSYVMELHQKNNNGNRFIINQMSASYKIPTNFDKLMYMSMVLQAEGIRYGVEHWRRNKKRVSGTLYWQLNDCWPVASWASIDYYGRWKALHYAAKRFYAPVLLSLYDEDTHVAMHLTNDLPRQWNGEIRWRLETLTGSIREQGSLPVSVEALESREVCAVDLPVPDGDRRDLVFIADLFTNNTLVATQISIFAPNKHVNYVDPQLVAEVSQSGDDFIITLTAKTLARYVEVKMEGFDAVFSDNYFDLPAGKSISVTTKKPEGWTVETAQTALRLMHLHASYSD